MMRIKKQTSANDCGLAVLQSIYKKLNSKWIDMSELRSLSFITKKGLNIYSLISLGNKIGIELTSYDVEFKDLEPFEDYLVTLVKTEEGNHFVLFRIFKTKVEVLDPVRGTLYYERKDFESIFLGYVISYKKIFSPETKGDHTKWYTYLFTNKPILTTLMASSVISIVFVFISSLYMKIILDTILPQRLENQLVVISLIFLWVSIMKTLNIFFKQYMQRKLNLKIELELSLKYYESISRGKLIHLDKITESDHIRRISFIQQMSGFASSVFFVIFSDSMLLVSSSCILMWVNIKLFLVVFILGLLNLASTVIINIFIKDKQDLLLENQMKDFSNSYNFALAKERLKFTNEREFLGFKRINSFREHKKTEQDIWTYKTWYNVLDSLLDFVSPIVITFIGIKLIFASSITVGELFMFSSLFRSFLQPLDSLGSTMLRIPLGLRMIKLVEEILYIEHEELNETAYIPGELKTIELKNVSFSYDKKILDIKSLKIDNNINLVGPNASGKSTFIKCLSTLYDFEGMYKINNYGLEFLNKQAYRDSIYFSHPKEFIPATKVFEFITQMDEKRIKTLEENIGRFSLEKLLVDMNIDLSLLLESNGTNISSGQLQVIKALRLLTKKYSLVLLDEASENIDDKNLEILRNAINKFQTSLFVQVSHNDKYLVDAKEVKFDKINKCA